MQYYMSTNVRFYLSYDTKITLKIVSKYDQEIPQSQTADNKSHFCRKNVVLFCHYIRNVAMDVITFPENL